MATSRFGLISHRSHWCVFDLDKRERVEGSCLPTKWHHAKRSVATRRDKLNEEWKRRQGDGGASVRPG